MGAMQKGKEREVKLSGRPGLYTLCERADTALRWTVRSKGLGPGCAAASRVSCVAVLRPLPTGLRLANSVVVKRRQEHAR